MSTDLTLLAIFALSAYALGGSAVAVWFARRTGRVFNLRTLLLANYIVVSLVSGVVHLMSLRNVSRGFFDVLSGSADTLIVATLGSILGLVALVAGCMIGLPRSRA